MTNSVLWRLIWIYNFCSGLSVRIRRVCTVILFIRTLRKSSWIRTCRDIKCTFYVYYYYYYYYYYFSFFFFFFFFVLWAETYIYILPISLLSSRKTSRQSSPLALLTLSYNFSIFFVFVGCTDGLNYYDCNTYSKWRRLSKSSRYVRCRYDWKH